MKIKEIISKPSQALQAMVDGLLHQSERPDFIIDMCVYGDQRKHNKKPTCFGCAATCTLQQIFNVNFKPVDHRKRLEDIGSLDGRLNQLPENLEYDDVNFFEMTMDYARNGDLHYLFDYFGFKYPDSYLVYPAFELSTENWQEQITAVQEHIEKLKEAGF